jgi:FemAB-related protein (PEP-CTERM system-associated)
MTQAAEALEPSSETVSISIATDSDAARWNEFVRSHPSGTFFHLFGWQSIIRDCLGHKVYFLMARVGERIVGVLPLARVKSWLFGDALTSTPMCVYGGAIGESQAVVSALERYAANLADELGVDYLELRNRAPTRDDWPVKDLYYTFRRTLDPDPEKNLQAIPRKQRAEVRAGIKNKLEVTLDAGLDCFYDIYSQNLRSLGTPVVSRRYFAALLQTFGSDCEISAVLHQGKPIASLVTFYFRDEVLPYYGGGLPEARRTSGYDFMYWDLMRRAAERGIRIYDFGRSKKDTGPFRYKKHWGFEPEPLGYQYHLVKSKAMPDVSPANPKYHVFIEAWKRMPLSLTRMLGPVLARYLG